MKKILSLLLSILLTIGAVLPVFADSADSALIEKLILTAKEKLAIDDNEMEFKHYYLNASEGENSFALYWEAKDENTYKEIHVVLSESGIIQSYYLFEDKAETKPSFSKYTQQEAIQAARAFIEKIDPEKLAETADSTCERNYDGAYTVSLSRVHNDIPVSGNFLTCTVDSDTLKITGYNAIWQPLTFAESAPISLEAAQGAYCDQVGYELFYQITSEDYKNTAHLIYRSRYDENIMIDALTGEAITHRDVYTLNRAVANKQDMTESATDASGGASLSVVEQALVEQVVRMLSRDKADQIARSLLELGITKDFQLEDYSLFRQKTGEYIISLTYRSKDTNKDEYTGHKRLLLEAETGRMIEYYSHEYTPYKDTKAKKEIPAETLQAKAKAFLKDHYAEELAQMTEKLSFTQEQSGLVLLRVVNGIQVYNNGASLQYDRQTGALISFSLNWTDADFPTADGVAASDAANAVAMEKGKFALRYMAIPAEDSKDMQTALVYSLEERPLLSSDDLTVLDYRLRPAAATTIPVYTDMNGHYARERIERLLSHEIYLPADENGCLHPDVAITQLDYFRLLDKVIWRHSYSSDSDELYRRLIRQGILNREEVAPAQPVNRIDAIRYLLCALGYGEFVKIPGIFRCPFVDISAENEGIAAVAYGLKLAGGDGGRFYPDAALKRADAMIILYNYMER